MVIGDFLGIVIVGAILSVAMQFIKKWTGTADIGNKALIIVLSIIVGGVYYLLRDTSWWESMLGVLASASTVYSLLIHKGGK